MPHIQNMSHWLKMRIDIQTDRQAREWLRSFGDIFYYICASRFSALLVRMKICRSVCLHVCTNVYIYIYMYFWMYVCIYVLRIYLSIYVCMYACNSQVFPPTLRSSVFDHIILSVLSSYFCINWQFTLNGNVYVLCGVEIAPRRTSVCIILKISFNVGINWPLHFHRRVLYIY